MAISDPLTVTLGGSGGTPYDLILIKRDGYNTEYRLRQTALDELTATVRHSVESPASGQTALERHSIQFKQTIFGAAGDPDVIRYVTVTLRCAKSDTTSEIEDLGAAMSYYMNAARFGDLIGWDS